MQKNCDGDGDDDGHPTLEALTGDNVRKRYCALLIAIEPNLMDIIVIKSPTKHSKDIIYKLHYLL